LLAETLKTAAQAEGGRLRLDLLKVSHHGSKGNTTAEMLERLDCQRFLFSSNGSRHGHPDPEAVARVLMTPADRKRTLYFNYASPWTKPWDKAELRNRHNYECVYGVDGAMIIEI
jgi:hypothetical protein